MPENATATQIEIGSYVCPKTKRTVPLFTPQHLASVEWPVNVQKCESCGETHVLQSEDVRHPPVFGYE